MCSVLNALRRQLQCSVEAAVMELAHQPHYWNQLHQRYIRYEETDVHVLSHIGFEAAVYGGQTKVCFLAVGGQGQGVAIAYVPDKGSTLAWGLNWGNVLAFTQIGPATVVQQGLQQFLDKLCTGFPIAA